MTGEEKDSKYWERWLEMHDWMKEIRGDLKVIKGNCERHQCELQDHENRIRTIEKEQGNIFKMILRPVLAIFGIKI